MSKCPSISGKKTPGPAHRMFSSLNKKQILFITDYLKKCHKDIFPCNICPGGICQYQGYLGGYLHNFDQTFGT